MIFVGSLNLLAVLVRPCVAYLHFLFLFFLSVSIQLYCKWKLAFVFACACFFPLKTHETSMRKKSSLSTSRLRLKKSMTRLDLKNLKTMFKLERGESQFMNVLVLLIYLVVKTLILKYLGCIIVLLFLVSKLLICFIWFFFVQVFAKTVFGPV